MSLLRCFTRIFAHGIMGFSGLALAQISDGPKSIHEFSKALPGKKIEIWKKWDSKTNTFKFVTNSNLVMTSEDLVNLEVAEYRLQKQVTGALIGTLQSEFSEMDDSKELDVIVSMKYPAGITYLDKTLYPEHVLKNQSLQIASIEPIREIGDFLSEKGLKNKGKLSRVSAITTLKKSDLKKLMFLDELATIEPYLPKTLLQGGVPFSALASSAYNHSTAVVPATAGSGINAGTFEFGLTQEFVNCMGIPAGFQSRLAISPSASMHSMATFRCLTHAAPGANWWHLNSNNFSGPSNEAWIITNNIQSLSQSLTNGGGPSQNSEYIVMDDFAYRSPFPVFSNPTGNAGYSRIATWQAYNGINVGNVQHTNQNHFELVNVNDSIGGCTQTKNPPAIYGGGPDREMPYLVAPGFTPPGTSDPCGSHFSNELVGCGTSFSAPIVNGMAADVLAADVRMSSWPEKVRAALMVTAQNVHGGYWSTSIDGKDGAGVVHGAGAVDFAKTHTSAYPDGPAAQNGMGAGSIYASDFNSQIPIVFKISIPSVKPAGKHLRVVLTWDSNPVVGSNINALSDLNLLVTTGSVGMASESINGNVEMVDIPNTMFATGTTVDARIFKWINRIPAGGRANFFYYAIAWTWVKDHAD